MDKGSCTHTSTSLMLVDFGERFAFRCNGCKEMGYGSCYTCQPHCNYHLHKDCQMSTPTTISHPFFTQGQFVLKKNGRENLHCEACGMNVQGWRYELAISRSSEIEISLHPCCMNLPYTNNVNGELFALNNKLSCLNLCCAHCDQQEAVKGWAYVSTRLNLAFHVKCIKDMHHQNWEKNYYPLPQLCNDDVNNKSNYRGSDQQRGLKERRFRKRDLLFGTANIALTILGLGGTWDIALTMVELAKNIWGGSP